MTPRRKQFISAHADDIREYLRQELDIDTLALLDTDPCAFGLECADMLAAWEEAYRVDAAEQIDERRLQREADEAQRARDLNRR